MIAAVLALVILVTTVIQATCTVMWLLLLVRLWRDLRPSRTYELCGTLVAVLVYGGVSFLCGWGAHSISQAAQVALLGIYS